MEPAVFDIQMVEELPRDPVLRSQLSAVMDGNFLAQFEYGLSRSELTLWRREGLKSQQITDRLDEFILGQARVLGWRLFLCDAVLRRIAHWWWQGETNGPQLLSQLGKNLSLGAKVIRGKAHLPLKDTAFYQFKRDLVSELRRLLNRLRVLGAKRNRLPGLEELGDLIQQEVMKSGQPYPRLWENLTAFLKYLEWDEKIVIAIGSGEGRPAQIADNFIGWSTNQDPESTRQRISRLGSQKACP